ncbi:hypothetical protein [Herminiimonas sp. CN]|uniref:hypothetical protein n=1 Tax=Herminiimonas sp. CN TaxID=1349818 RepID=UPI0012DF930E|nr:hypothetical protein [Herminiimonas sp. CN]
MKISCNSIFLALLLAAAGAGASAEPGRGRGERQQDQAQQEYYADRNAERGTQRNDRACPGPYGCEQNGPNANGRAAARNTGKMTPEERSALRRQINEAGQDIYSGKYKR